MKIEPKIEPIKNETLRNFIHQVVSASANITLYDQNHPQTSKLVHKALEYLEILFQSCLQVEMKIVENRLVFNNDRVEDSFLITKFIDSLKQKNILFIRFIPGVVHEEIISFVKNIGRSRINNDSGFNTEHISCGSLEVRYKNEEPLKNTQLIDFSEIAETHIDGFMDIYQRIRKKQKLNIVGIQDIVHDFVEAFHSHSNILVAIAPLRDMDDYVYVHSTNICLLNMAQGRLLGVNEETLNVIGVAAMLHDVGKMFISSDILNKKGKLTPEEWDIIKQHPKLGAEYLIGCPGIPCLAVINAYEHHIGFDGKGYPFHPPTQKLHPCSHMTSISDVYDALRTRRSYKEPLTSQQINDIMLGYAGKSLHPELTYSFLNAISKIESEAKQSSLV